MGHARLKTIGVVTVSRSDYGLYTSILRKITSDPDLVLKLFVSGTHLSEEFGSTYRNIEADGFEITERIENNISSDLPKSISSAMGLGTIGFAEAYQKHNIDILLVLGDRYEMHSAVVAALPFQIPVAHIHGGEVTEGAIDNSLRNSITKLSHIHFAATEVSRQNIINMGEEPWRIVVCGAPGLETIYSFNPSDKISLADQFCVNFDDNPLLVTYHPVTLEQMNTEWQVQQLLEALRVVKLPIIFTMPNADTHYKIIRQMFTEFTQECTKSKIYENLGSKDYINLMTYVAAMVGNSSSGIIEAPSLELPVVNIGSRQQGRERAPNVIDVGYDQSEIVKGIKKAISPKFKYSLRGITNPYMKGNTSGLIVNHLKYIHCGESLIIKKNRQPQS